MKSSLMWHDFNRENENQSKRIKEKKLRRIVKMIKKEWQNIFTKKTANRRKISWEIVKTKHLFYTDYQCTRTATIIGKSNASIFLVWQCWNESERHALPQ